LSSWKELVDIRSEVIKSISEKQKINIFQQLSHEHLKLK